MNFEVLQLFVKVFSVKLGGVVSLFCISVLRENLISANSNTPCSCCIDISHYAWLLSTHMTGCSIFSKVQ